MSIRTLLAMLVAFAVLLAPALTRAGEASAAVPDHHAGMMKPGHCEGAPAKPGDEGRSSAKDCISMCAGIALDPVTRAAESDLEPIPAVFAVPALHLPFLGEIATPPPRRS